MPRNPRLHLSRSLLQALLAAHREAWRSRRGRAPSRLEMYQALLDTAVLTGDEVAVAWFEAVEPVRDRSHSPLPLRSLLSRLRRRAGETHHLPIQLVELARLVTGNNPRIARTGNLPATKTETLPVPWEAQGRLPSTRGPGPEREAHGTQPPGAGGVPFHCPECCPSPRREKEKAKERRRSPGEQAEAFLESIGGELTDPDKLKALNPASGRGLVMDRILEAMLMMHRPNPILVGPSGVGKSAVLEGIARRILQGDVPERLRGLRIFRMDANLFRAQAGIIGRIEDFLERLVHSIEAVAPAYLAIDEFHLICGTGAHKDDPKGAEQYVREHLARGRLRILGTTTPGEYQRFISEDRALEARLVRIPLEEPSLPVARRMVRMAARRMEEHFRSRIAPALADYATTLCFEHPRDKALPLSAIDLLDWSLARAEARGRRPERADVEQALADNLGCEVEHIRQQGSDRIRSLHLRLAETIKGQPRATEETVAALKPYSAGLKDRNRPAAVLLFAGPTGVGKTETAKQIAAALFGSERNLVRVAMADFTDSWGSTRLLGSGPGYVGHEKGGWLVRRLRETPSCVLLLDEFDRAHQAVRDLFLEAFDNARLVDSRGLEASLTHTMVILTSNLGADGSRTPGFTRERDVTERERLIRLLKTELSPALVGRLTAIIPFDALGEQALEEILEMKLRQLETRLGVVEGRVVLDRALRDRIIQRGFAPATGARGLDEALEKLVIRPLAHRILEEGLPQGEEQLELGLADLEG